MLDREIDANPRYSTRCPKQAEQFGKYKPVRQKANVYWTDGDGLLAMLDSLTSLLRLKYICAGFCSSFAPHSAHGLLTGILIFTRGETM